MGRVRCRGRDMIRTEFLDRNVFQDQENAFLLVYWSYWKMTVIAAYVSCSCKQHIQANTHTTFYRNNSTVACYFLTRHLSFSVSFSLWCVFIAAHLPSRKSCPHISSAIHLTYTTILPALCVRCCVQSGLLDTHQGLKIFLILGAQVVYWSAEKQSLIPVPGTSFYLI